MNIEKWQCPICKCRSYARCDQMQPDGRYQAGPAIRCVDCKELFQASGQAYYTPVRIAETAAASVIHIPWHMHLDIVNQLNAHNHESPSIRLSAREIEEKGGLTVEQVSKFYPDWQRYAVRIGRENDTVSTDRRITVMLGRDIDDKIPKPENSRTTSVPEFIFNAAHEAYSQERIQKGLHVPDKEVIIKCGGFSESEMDQYADGWRSFADNPPTVDELFTKESAPPVSAPLFEREAIRADLLKALAFLGDQKASTSDRLQLAALVSEICTTAWRNAALRLNAELSLIEAKDNILKSRDEEIKKLKEKISDLECENTELCDRDRELSGRVQFISEDENALRQNNVDERRRYDEDRIQWDKEKVQLEDLIKRLKDTLTPFAYVGMLMEYAPYGAFHDSDFKVFFSTYQQFEDDPGTPLATFMTAQTLIYSETKTKRLRSSYTVPDKKESHD